MPSKKKLLNSAVTPEGQRTTGRGFLTIGLVSMAVKLYKPSDEFETGFRMLHATCGTPIQQKVHCPKCNKTIENKQVEICKGIEVAKDKFIAFNPAELEDVRAEASREFEVQGFLPEADAASYVRSGSRSYVGADPEQPCDGYRVMFASLVDSGLVGMVHYTQRGFESQAILRADKALGIFVLEDVLYADEIRSAQPVPRPVSYDVRAEELDLSKALISSMVIKPSDVGNSPNKARLQAFKDKKIAEAEARAKGEEIKPAAAAPDRTHALDDLMSRLKASLNKIQTTEDKEWTERAISEGMERKAS
jgi:DNA end-binding protein Ku